jgi:hypothetical protein
VIRCSVSPESEFFGLLRSDVYVLCRISFPCCYVPVTDGGLSVHKVLGMDAMSIHPTHSCGPECSRDHSSFLLQVLAGTRVLCGYNSHDLVPELPK